MRQHSKPQKGHDARAVARKLCCSVALLLAIGVGCSAGPTCHGPIRAGTPARMVPAPKAGLLELSHTHPDLEERVIYGLPVCG